MGRDVKTYTFTATDAEVWKLVDHLAATLGPIDKRVADELRGQLKPAVEEPQEFASVVRATSHGEPMLWQKTPMHGKHYWESETGAVEVWSELTDVEVLRVGVGEPGQVDGFCSCPPDGRARDCGIRRHRVEALS